MPRSFEFSLIFTHKRDVVHNIEPHYLWRDSYVAAEDHRSPHYGRTYNEFTFTNKIYNYFIHPQWDEFGSPTLYGKILFADYEDHIAIVELIGEWNDCLGNDILFLKQNVVDRLQHQGIHQFVIIMDHVLTFHGSDNCYYEEWYEDASSEGGYICFLNTSHDVAEEMASTRIDHFVQFGDHLQIPNWRSYKPLNLIRQIESRLNHRAPMQLP